MHRTKNTSRKRRTHRGVINFPADGFWPALAFTVIEVEFTDPHMTTSDLVVLNPLTVVAGVTYEASITPILGGGIKMVAVATNVSGAQMAFPGVNVRYGILPS